MAARLFLELILGLLLVAAILWASYRFAAARQPLEPRPVLERDVSLTPSAWFTDSRTTDDGGTEVCIIRVATKTGTVLERRVLRRLDNAADGYSTALDAAMDEAYAAMRVANVNLHRR